MSHPEPPCIHPLARRMVLYTDTVGGKQAHRDDLWAVSTEELNGAWRERNDLLQSLMLCEAHLDRAPIQFRKDVREVIEQACGTKIDGGSA